MESPVNSLVRTTQKNCWLTLTLLAAACMSLNTIFLFFVAGRPSLIADLVAVCFGLAAQMAAFGRRFYPSPLQRDAGSAQQAHALLDGVWSRAKDDLALLEGRFSKDRIAWQGAFAAAILAMGILLQFGLARNGAPVASISVGTAALLLAFCLVPWMLYAPLVMSWMTIVVTTASFAGAFSPLTLAACLLVGIESCLFTIISDRLVTATCFADLKTKAAGVPLQWLRPIVQLIVLSCLTFVILPTPDKQKKPPFTAPTKQKTMLPSPTPKPRLELAAADGKREDAAAVTGDGWGEGTVGGASTGTSAAPAAVASTGPGAGPGAGPKAGGNPGKGVDAETTSGTGSGSGRKVGTAGGAGRNGGPSPNVGPAAETGAPGENRADSKAPRGTRGTGEAAGTSADPPQVTGTKAPKKRVATGSPATKPSSARKVTATDWKKILMLALVVAVASLTAFLLLRKKHRPENEAHEDSAQPDSDEEETAVSPTVTKRDLADALRRYATGKMPGDGRALVVHLYNLTLKHLKARGLPRKRSQTPDEYARLNGVLIRSAGVELHRVTDLFSRVLYGRVDPLPDEIVAYVQSVQKLAEKV